MQTPESQFNNPEYLTAEGYEELKKELDELENQRLPEIAKLLEETRSDGDLAENAAYQSAKDKQGMLEEERVKKINILSCAVIISKEKGENIQPGSTVSLKKDDTNEMEKYFLVGAKEADPLEGKISNESPLGSALIGRKKGEKINVLTPNGKINYTIIDVG